MVDPIDENIDKIGDQLGDQLDPPAPGSPRRRSWNELQSTGLLWYINSLLHPRGFAIAVHRDDDGSLTGWSIMGDGSEPIAFVTKEIAELYDIEVESPVDANAKFAAFEKLLKEASYGR